MKIGLLKFPKKCHRLYRYNVFFFCRFIFPHAENLNSNHFFLFPIQPIPWWEASPPNTRLTERNMTGQPNSGQRDTPHKPTEDSRRRRGVGGEGWFVLCWGEGGYFYLRFLVLYCLVYFLLPD